MDQQAPLVDDSLGTHALAVITPILAVAILLFSIRIYTRVHPTYKLDASDYTNSVAILSEVITYALFAASISCGFGRHSTFIPPQMRVKILQLLFGVVLVGLWASSFARISVACLLLKFATSTTTRAILWITVGFQIASLLGTEIVELLTCRPIQALWEEVPNAQCFRPEQMWVVGWAFIGIGIVGDLMFAIMPMFLIQKLGRSVVERCLISFLMALGLFATAAGFMRAMSMKTFSFTDADMFRVPMPVYMWSRIEEIILIAASSAPLLKAPVEHALHRLGLPTFQHTARELNSFRSHQVSDKRQWYNFWMQQKLERRGAEDEGNVTTSGDWLELKSPTAASP